MTERLWDFVPAATDCRDGFEAAWGELVGASVAAIHGPVEQVDLVGIELQEQDDDFTAKLVDLSQEWKQCRRRPSWISSLFEGFTVSLTLSPSDIAEAFVFVVSLFLSYKKDNKSHFLGCLPR